MVLPAMSGALKEGAGAPGFAVAADGTAVACSTAKLPIAASAATARVLLKARMRASVVSESTLPDGVEHTRRGQDLRQHDGLAPSAGVEQIERNPAAPELLQKLSDFRVLTRPVTLEGNDAALSEGLADGTAVEGDPFIDQAGDAPGSRQIDKNRLACGFQSGEPLRRKRLVFQSVAEDGGFGRHCSRQGSGEKDCSGAPGCGQTGTEPPAERRGKPRLSIDPHRKSDEHQPEQRTQCVARSDLLDQHPEEPSDRAIEREGEPPFAQFHPPSR